MRIHIVCPGDQVNGSVESLHQFGRAASLLGYDTRIAYEPFDILGPVASAFRGYGVRNDQDVPDEADVLVLVPQSATHLVAELTRVQKMVWWLRVDDDLDVAAVTASAAHAIHVAQSEHARRYLDLHGISARVLGDYVHSNFVQRAASLIPVQRLDTVLYNPDPSDEFTPQLIEASRGVLQWVPVQGLSRDEVAEIMAYAKLYVDFGAHPGRTRLPREALAAGCCVISGRRGAAGNGVDLPLPDGFTFDEADPDAVKDVLNRIALTIVEFDQAVSAFEQPTMDARVEDSVFRVDVATRMDEVLNEVGLGNCVKRSRESLARASESAATSIEVERRDSAPAEASEAPMAPVALVPGTRDGAVTVVIPTIPPRAKLLRRALDSVIGQTRPPAAVVVEWDHGRTGAAATKNRGIDKVATEWVAMLDDDDSFLPEHLEKLHRCAMENDADVVYSIPRAQRGGKPVPELRFGLPFDADELRRAPYIPNTVLVRADLVRKVGGFEPVPGTVWDDYGLFLKLLAVGAKFVHLPEVTWTWNQVGEGTAGVPTAW